MLSPARCHNQATPFFERWTHLNLLSGAKRSCRVRRISDAMSQAMDNPGSEEGSAVLVAEAGRKVVLEARDISKSYGEGERSLNVLQHVNLALYAGEMAAIVAPSGAG